jgi:hypothetical protein
MQNQKVDILFVSETHFTEHTLPTMGMEESMQVQS